MSTTPRQTSPAVTRELVAARKVAAEIIPLIESECEGKSLDFTRRLWALVQERSIREIGLPKRAVSEVEPLNDRQAESFGRSVLTFGKHQGHTVEEIHTADPDYLAVLADGSAFTKQLKRYLARSKYHQEEGE